MKRTSNPFNALLAVTFLATAGSAQQPPPPVNAPPPPPAGAAAQPASWRQGTIKAFNSGPHGETNGLILNDGTVVLFPPKMGEQFRSSVSEGSPVTVTGVIIPGAMNRMIVKAQTITANGQTFTAPIAPPPPHGGPGRSKGPGPAAADGPPPPGPEIPR